MRSVLRTCATSLPRSFSSRRFFTIKVDIPGGPALHSQLSSPKAWTSRTIEEAEPFVTFTPAAQEELVKYVKGYLKNSADKSPEPFVPEKNKLKQVGKEMKTFEKRARDELGFVVVRGVKDLENIHEKRFGSVAMTAFLGDLIAQNAEGVKAILVYDRDHTRYMKDGGRYHQTHEGGSLHTDNVNVPEVWDYMILSCLHAPLLGGESIVCSTFSIHNYLNKHAPETLDTLAQPFMWEYRGFSDAFYRAPILFYELGSDNRPQPHIRYLRDYMESAHKRLNQPFTGKQLRALDALDAVANLSEVQFRFTMNPGDMFIAYDTQVLHGRTAFVDPSPAQQVYDLDHPSNRLLQRTWAKWRNGAPQ